jgi:hypothetical protein
MITVRCGTFSQRSLLRVSVFFSQRVHEKLKGVI